MNVGGTATTTGTPANRSTEGWGVGGSLEYQVMPKVLDAQVSLAYGDGIGRYVTSGLSDIAFSPDGNMHPIPERAIMGGVTWHATPQLDVYAYAGGEWEDQTSFDMRATPASAITHGGFGNPFFTNNFACGVETTVPFKPTQGRPVLCRSCFQMKRVPSGVAAVAQMDSPAAQVAAAVEQVLPNGDTSSSADARTTIGLIAQTPVLVETPDASSLAVSEAHRA